MLPLLIPSLVALIALYRFLGVGLRWLAGCVALLIVLGAAMPAFWHPLVILVILVMLTALPLVVKEWQHRRSVAA
jgi:hypothetical protein